MKAIRRRWQCNAVVCYTLSRGCLVALSIMGRKLPGCPTSRMLSTQLFQPRQSWSPRPCVRYQNGNSQWFRTSLHSLIWRPSRVADTPPLLPISRYGYRLYVADACLCSEVLLPGGSWSSSGSGSM